MNNPWQQHPASSKTQAGSQKKNLQFEYDALGNRVAKHQFVYAPGNSGNLLWEKSTYYGRDAQGNVISVYEETPDNNALAFKLKERNIYGSSRVSLSG